MVYLGRATQAYLLVNEAHTSLQRRPKVVKLRCYRSVWVAGR